MAHYTPATPISENATTPYLFNAVHTFSLANIGVLFFFGLSSFLLTWLAEEKFKANGCFDWWQFLTHRFFRIVPLYVAVISVSLLVIRDNGWWPNFQANEIATRRYSIEHMWLYLAFVYNWVGAFIGFNGFKPHDFNEFGHLWTLSVEVQFYLLFAVLFTALRASPGKIQKFLFMTVFSGVLARIAFVAVMSLGSANQPAGLLYFYSLSYLEVFALSAGAGIIFARRGDHGALMKWLSRPGAGLAIGASLLLIGWVWKFYLWIPPPSSTRFEVLGFYGIAIALYSAVGFVVAVSLLWLATNRERAVGRFLRLPLLQALGTLSYGIYMWHLPSKFLLYGFDRRILSGLAGDRRVAGVVLMFGVYLAFTVALAAITYVTIELPSNRIRGSLDSKHGAPVRSAGLGARPFKLVSLAFGMGGAALVAIFLLRI